MEEIWKSTIEQLTVDSSYRNMFRLIENFGNRVAWELLSEAGEVIERSYSEYARMSRLACGYLEKAGGYAPGAVVGLSVESNMDWPVLFWGILMSGGIPLLLNPSMLPAQQSAILAEARAKAYVAATSLENVVVPFIHADAVLHSTEVGEERWADMVALCTSGTTGSSRIFLYDGKTIVSQLQSFNTAKKVNDDMPFIEGMPCKLLAFLPFHHVFGFSVIYMLYSCTGNTIVYLRDRTVPAVMQTCQVCGVTHLYCVPMFFNALAAGVRRKFSSVSALPEAMKAQIRAGLLGTQLRLMITGGGHVPAETLELLNDVGYPLYNGFGMTECGIISVELSLDPEQRKKGSIGIPFPPNEYRLTAPGVGELQLRGDALYTASIVDGVIVPRDREMWFSTGDLVRQEADGLYIVGRSKDVIINASGENIYPDELEDGFADLPGVTQFSILGLREKGYEVVTLVIVPSAKFDAEVLQEAVKQVNAGLNPNERVLRLLVSKQALPMSGSMKVQRGKLREGLESGTWPVAALWGNEKSVETPKAVSAGSNNELDSIKVSLRRIIADNLSIDENTIGDNDDFQRDLGGDSLTLVGASIEIGERFDLVLTDEEIREMTSINAAAAVLCRRLYGYGGEKVRQQPKAARRITNFRDSEEYMALKARIDDTFRDGTPNPYFLPHDSLIRDTSIIHGQQVVNLGSYNYLGMSGHPETMAAAIEAIRKYGTSASGSRTLAGEKTLYQELERSIADWKHSEAAIVCTGGWATNLTFIASFMKEGDFILYDALSHNSIADGVALSKAESRAFPHNDLNALERLLQKLEGHYSKVLIVVEGVYSMDGDIAPIPEFVRLKEQYGCFLMVDEAHSGGVLGEWGGGVEEYFHLDPRDIDIKYGTMSKALGTCGGFIAADASIIEYLRYSMDGFVFTAGIAPPLAAACMKAIELIRRDNKAVTQLHKNIAYFVRRCKDEGMNTCLAGESAIVPILIGTDKDAARLSAELLQEGIFIPPAMYPAVPMGESRLRVTISATHTEEQLEHAVSALSALMRREGFLPTKG